MSQRAKSRAQYEDDLLALLMDGLLEEEGLALLEENERLNADPEAAVPADLDEKCRALLRSSFPDEPLKKAGRVTLKVLKRVLVAAVVAAALFATAYAAVPEFRAGVLRIITNITDFGTEFYFRSTGTETSTPTSANSLIIKDGMPFEFSYVPEGCEQILREAYDQGANGIMYQWAYGYSNDDLSNFDFEISPISEGTGLFVDTEDAEITYMKIRGFDGQLIRKTHASSGKECVSYLWFDLENHLMYRYTSVGVPFEESQRIFDGIVIYGYETDTPAPTLAPSSPLVIKDGMPFEFSYVPEGYELFSREAYDCGANGIIFECAYDYPNDDPNNFDFQISPISEGTGQFVDTEDATITYLKIHGHDGQLIQKKHALTGRSCVTYLWFDLENELMFCYNSIGISFEESQRIFDGIVIYE